MIHEKSINVNSLADNCFIFSVKYRSDAEFMLDE